MKRDSSSDTDYERLADLAEQGFDPNAFHVRRRGRPSLSSSGISPRIATRVSAQVHDLAMARAASEGRTMSQVLRNMVEDYARGPNSERVRDRPSPAGGARRGAKS
jgi:hypothetical protein